MKKQITLLIIFSFSFFFGNYLFSQTWVEDVYIYEDYSTATGSWVDGTATQGVKTGGTLGDNAFSSTINTTNKNVEIKTTF